MKRIIGVFFILTTLISVSFLSSACENESPNKEPSIIAETNTGKYLNEEENTESPMEEGEQKIYISYLSIPEIIHLSNNGVGIDFIVDYLPKNTTENIDINIENNSVINFASEISEENRKNLINFTETGNILYPLSIGETLITVTASSSEFETISKTCLVIVEHYEQALEMQILNQYSTFMSGQKANGEYEIYSAKISSLNSIENKNFYINKSNNLQIIEDSFSYYQENQFYYFLFDFYLIEKGEHFLEVSVEENYLNFVTLKSDKLDFSSVNFVNSIDLEIKRANNLEVLKENSKFLLYLVENETLSTEADLEGFFNNYIVNFINISFENLSIEIKDNSIVSFTNVDGVYKITAKGIGETEIIISAIDGSNQSVALNFKVSEIMPSQLKIGEVDLLSDYSKEDLDQELGDIELVLNGEHSSAELTILISKYVKNSYACFVPENENLTISCVDFAQENAILKTFTFEAKIVGTYTVNLIVDDEIIYSFSITVKPYLYEFKFQESIPDSNIKYDFVNRQITVSSFYIDNPIFVSFYCSIYKDNKNVEGIISLSFDDSFCETQSLTLSTICLKIKKVGIFRLTITDSISNLSTIFTIIVNE